MKKQRRNFIVGIVCVLGVVFSACAEDEYIYIESQTLEKEVWNKNNLLMFHFKVTDTVNPYYIGFNVCYTDEYPAQNLYVFLHTTLPNGMRMHDTVLTDLFYLDGSPLGKGNRIKELQQNITKIVFPLQGEYFIQIEQALRIDTMDIENLKGITSMGLYIKSVNQLNTHEKEKQNQ